MNDKANKQPADVAVPEFSAELLKQFTHMVTLVPAEDGAGQERILAAILAAETIDDLDAPWDTTKADKLAGKVLRIDQLMRRPSDFRAGLGIFLVVHSVDTVSGEKIVWTTSSVSIVGQLVRAYALGKMPCYAELIIAERPTRDGYHPHHLKFYGSPADTPAGVPADAEPVF